MEPKHQHLPFLFVSRVFLNPLAAIAISIKQHFYCRGTYLAQHGSIAFSLDSECLFLIALFSHSQMLTKHLNVWIYKLKILTN